MAAWAAGAITLDPRRIAKKIYHQAQRIEERRTHWIEHTPKTAIPRGTQEDPSRGFVVSRRSILERVHPDSTPAEGETPASIHLQAAWGQYEAAQLAVHAASDVTGVDVAASDLHDDHGHVLPATAIETRMERFYTLQLSITVRNRLGVVPKTLEPAVPITVPAHTTRPYWITVHVADGQPGGMYRGTITVHDDQGHHEDVPLDVEVLPLRLDEPQALLGPLSLPLLRNLAEVKGPEAEYILDRADMIFGDIREHGMTTMSLWSGTVYREADGRLVLPDLDAAMELFRRHGFPQPLLYAPVNLLSTNKLHTSSNYRHFDSAVHVQMATAIARDYTQRAIEVGIPGIIFDPVEEPNYASGVAWSDAPDLRQRIATELLAAMKQAGGSTAMTCTPETAQLGQGNLDYWLVAYKRFSPGVFAQAERANAHVAMYANGTLMGNGTYFSRFFFGYYPWANRLAGMMAWTYPMLPKRFPVNIEGRAEGPLHVVDGFLGSDGKPIPVIQWELAREGVDDFRYLVTIENLAERARRSGNADAKRAADDAARFLDAVRGSIGKDPHRYTFEDPRTFEPKRAVGWDDTQFEQTRRRSFELVKQLTSLLGRD